jgi:hypothetical protein
MMPSKRFVIGGLPIRRSQPTTGVAKSAPYCTISTGAGVSACSFS